MLWKKSSISSLVPVCLLAGCQSIYSLDTASALIRIPELCFYNMSNLFTLTLAALSTIAVSIWGSVKKKGNIKKEMCYAIKKPMGFKVDHECDKCFQSINIFFILFPQMAASRCYWKQFNLLCGFDNLSIIKETKSTSPFEKNCFSSSLPYWFWLW